MQVFKTFFAMVRRNMGMMVMYTCIFVGMTSIISNVSANATAATFQDVKTPVTVVDRDGSRLSAAITDYLYSRQEAMPLEDEGTVLQDALYRRVTSYILFIPAGYEADFLRGDAPALEAAQVPDSYSGAYVDGQLQGYLQTVRAYTDAGLMLETALATAGEDAAAGVSVALTQAEVKRAPAVANFFQYMCYGLVMAMMFGLAPVLMAFNTKELAARMNASALPLRRRNTQVALGALVLAVLCYAFYIAIGFVLYRDAMLGAGALLCVLNGFVFLLFSTALGLLVGMVSKNGNMISAIGNVVGMALCFLGGVFVPGDLLGGAMRTVTKFLPTYWYMQVVNTAAGAAELGAQAMQSVWEGMGIQLVFAAAILAVALVVSKTRQRTA